MNALNKLKRMIQLMVGRCVITAVKNDKYQLSMLADVSRDDIELFQHYGYKSVPPVDSECITVSQNGVSDAIVIIATKDATKIELKEGETALFNKFNALIKLVNDGSIEVNGSSKPFVTHVELDSALQSMLTQINAHTHTVPTAIPLPPATVPPPTTPPLTPATLDISASATTTVFTDG